MVLVQREEQVARLWRAFRDCEQGQRGRVALVTGFVGSGKTALLERFSEMAVEAGGRVLGAAASRAERGLHLGVLEQLLQDARLDQEAATRIDGVMRDAAFAVPVQEPDGGTAKAPATGHREWAPLLHVLHTTLLVLAGAGPLVLTVDDVHHADLASLHCLLYVTRRLRHAPIMVVLTEGSTLRRSHLLFRAELVSQPYFCRVALPPLTVDAIAELVTGDAGAATREAAERHFRMTGGNPLLVRALIEERGRSGADDEGGTPTGGDVFEQVVLGCLYRHEPGVRQAAQALAVVDRPVPAELLGHLLGMVPEAAAPAVLALRAAGLIDSDRLRHPRIRRAILADMSPEQRGTLHRRAAEALHEHGAEPRVVAEHLVAAGWAEDAWSVPVLQDAAERALASGRPDLAAACLRLVTRAGVAEQRRAATTAMLVNARWQVNPLAVNGYLTELVEHARADGCASEAALSAVPYLLWQGRAEEASEVVGGDCLVDDHGTGAPGPAALTDRLRAARLLVSLSHPDHLRAARERPGRWSRAAGAPATVSPLVQAVAVLGMALTPAGDGDLVTTAEQLLHRHHTDGDALALLAAPLLALLWSGRADRVAVWGDLLLTGAALRHTPAWRAIVRAVRAEAALRLGDLPGAQRHAQMALEELPPPAWGVAVAGPLGTLISCATEAGQLGDAGRWLAHPVPAGTGHTPLDLHYLAARGRHHLAAGRPRPAIADLSRCGELMRAWRIDVAGLVPWRLELARAYLSTGNGGGNETEAVRLLREQLDVRHGVDDRTRGRSLRLLAATATPDGRRKLLSEAVDLLRGCGDRLELVHALYDYGQTLQQAGDFARARPLIRVAYQVAQDCGAPALAERLIGRDPGRGLPHPVAAEVPQPDDGLSEAERRVAALAAQGHTNRQISSALFISVSTVEQHLTRVYRKLEVKRRSDLPARLMVYAEPLAAETAGGMAS